MPELPEVQTVLDTLKTQIKDLKITDIKILYKPIVDCNEKVFKKSLVDQHFRQFKRRGKYLLFEMDDITLVSHLRMEGKYFILDEATPLSKHDHVIFYLSNGKQLRYNDVRKFGRMELIPKEKDYKIFKELGVEPFSDDFSVEYCKQYLSSLKKPIKEVLLDQSFIAGIGNIYADEILYAIKINPNTHALDLNTKDIKNLIKHTRIILGNAIKAGGTTIRSYTSSLGVTGRFQLSLKVHTMNKCPKCKGDIKKIVVGSRGTYYCPNCQKKRIKLAITGSIGSGKTEASNAFRRKGYYVFDADETNRQLLEKNHKGYKEVMKQFPMCFEEGNLDKKKLSSIVFNDVKARKTLESIMHPLILEEMKKQMDKYDFFIAEIPLLFESKWDKYFNNTLMIASNESTTIKRLKGRGFTPKEAKERIKNQMSVEEKEKRATKVIYNNGSLNELDQSIEEYIKELC